MKAQNQQTEISFIQNHLKQSIQLTCTLNSTTLFHTITQKLQNTPLKYHHIKSLQCSQSVQQLPLQIYIPKTGRQLTQLQLKYAFFGALMYPLQLLPTTADILFVQMYTNVPIQLIISAECGYPCAVDSLAFLRSLVGDNYGNGGHKFCKCVQEYQRKIDGIQYQVINVSRPNAEQIIFKADKKVFDFSYESEQYLDNLYTIWEQLKEYIHESIEGQVIEKNESKQMDMKQ